MSKKRKKCPFCQGEMILENDRYRCVKCSYSMYDISKSYDAGSRNQSSTKNHMVPSFIAAAVGGVIGISN